MHFQPDGQEILETAFIVDFLTILLNENMYDELRTKKQLGYLVGCMHKLTGGIHGISFVIQSAEHSPPDLEDYILKFLDQFYDELFTKENFDNFKKGHLVRKKTSINSLALENAEYVSNITRLSSN